MTVLDAAAAERGKLRRVLGRMDTVFLLISAMVVVDTIGAIAVGGGETFTWLVVLFVTFFIPSALASAELGAALPEEGGAYVWVRRAFGRYAGALTSLLYWAGTPMWLGGSVAVVAMAVYQPGGTGIAWLVASLATGWSALAAICLLWPGLGTADPDAALPAGFASQRRQFELLILTPIAAVVAAVTVYHLAARRRGQARSRRGRRLRILHHASHRRGQAG